MATQETQILDDIIVKTRRKMLTMGGAALAGLAFGGAKAANAAALTDADVLNFALNLEYLEANFYTLATQGKTIDQVGIGIGAGTTAAGTPNIVTKPGGPTKCLVPWSVPVVQAYANETATEEQKHVSFLRGALTTSAVAQPNLDLYNSFIALGNLIGVPNFDPFANDFFFLIGAYIFEDVGVSAYGGAAGLLTVNGNLIAAAGILAVEAYHAGLVRTSIFQADVVNGTNYQTVTQKISAVRAAAGLPYASANTPQPNDIGVSIAPTALNGAVTGQTGVTIVDATLDTSLAYTRNTNEVLAIVTGGTPGNFKGLFFPNGLNGTIS